MVRGRRLVALWAVGVTMAAALPGWSISVATPAAAAEAPGVGWGGNWDGQIGNGEGIAVASPVLVSQGARATDDTYLQVSVGNDSACGVTNSGRAYCWGKGSSGQLGNDASVTSTTPVLVAQGDRQVNETFRLVSVGNGFACGLTSLGRAFCWGSNMDGQLGIGNRMSTDVPTAVVGSLTLRSLSVGEATSCGVATDDSVYCWGSDRNGQMGTGSRGFLPATSPSRVSGGALAAAPAMASVSVGREHICAVALSGAAYCWGSNSFGQLGNGSTAYVVAPVLVTGSLSFRSVAAGEASSCGGTSDDSIYCWGSNSSGQLGTGNTNNQPSPQQVVTSGVLSGQRAVAVSVFARTACALTQSGLVACWGDNDRGQVGDGSVMNRSAPTAVIDGVKPQGAAWSSVSAGDSVSCATSAGQTYCWGERQSGGLGNGTDTVVADPVDMVAGQMGASESLTTVSGGFESSCGIGSSRWVYCWGSGASGQLGNGSTSTTYAPQAIAQGPVPAATQFRDVTNGLRFGCALSTSGSVYCWGWNDGGQLGIGTSRDDTSVPVEVVDGMKPADDTWLAVSAGTVSACGIADDDSAYCWGYNVRGQLGIGTSGNTTYGEPQKVGSALRWKRISVGDAFACGIAIDDSAYCWGFNGSGQLGKGVSGDENLPTRVDVSALRAGETFDSIAAGYTHACGLTNQRRILCWGSGFSGELGGGTNQSSQVPVVTSTPLGLAGEVTYREVTAGRNFTCALAVTGEAYCWGLNSVGQIGDGTFTNRNVPVAVSGNQSTRFASLAAGSQTALATVLVRLPGAPALSSVVTSATSATITFTPGTDGGSVITNYEYSLDGGGWTALSPADAASPIVISNLAAATTYSVRLRAVNALVAGAASAPLSVTTQSAPTPTPAPPGPAPVTPPGVPVGVTATPGDKSVNMTWSPPVELGLPPASDYQVESTDPGASCTTSATSCVVAGLVNGREYSFRVRAVNDNAVGAWSAWTAKVMPVGVPSAPVDVVAVAGDDTALVSWQAPAEDGGTPILSYTVKATPGTVSCTVTTRSCEMTGLMNGTSYTFTVVATNAVGSSAPSAPSNAVTPKRRVEPSILISGSRSPRASGDRVTIIGVTTGLVGSEAQAWVKASGRKDFSRRGEPVVISETERFRWTGTIRRAAQVYFTADDVRSNKITLPRR